MAQISRWIATPLLTVTLAGPTATAAEDFQACVTRLQSDLQERGRDTTVVEQTFAEVRQLERIIELDRSQPEFVQTFWEYLDDRLTEYRVERGRQMMAEHEDLLWRIYDDFGIPPRYLVALWGMETNYGNHFGEVPIVDAMTTLACEGRRASFFFEQLDATVELIERGRLDSDPEQLRGSWAGALGHTQFMPSTLRDHAVDYDGSGQVDLRGSLPDALASAAQYLHDLGWDSGVRWGREVTLADDFEFDHLGLDEPQPLSTWRELGVHRADGSTLPDSDLKAALLLPMGKEGPAFLVYDNFRRILRWNASISYALSVGLLADRLDGHPPLRAEREDSEPIRHEELQAIQERLNELGYDTGTPDGIYGPRTQGALRAYQQDRGLAADGYPGPEVREALDVEAEE